MRAMGKKERSNNEGLWRYDAPGAKVRGQAPTRSKTGPRRKAGFFASCVALATRLRYEECGCRAPSLARKDGLGSSAE